MWHVNLSLTPLIYTVLLPVSPGRPSSPLLLYITQLLTITARLFLAFHHHHYLNVCQSNWASPCFFSHPFSWTVSFWQLESFLVDHFSFSPFLWTTFPSHPHFLYLCFPLSLPPRLPLIFSRLLRPLRSAKQHGSTVLTADLNTFTGF